MTSKIFKINLHAIFISILVLLSLVSCNNTAPGPPLYSPTFILDSFKHFWSYWYYNVNLSQNYVVFDKNNKRITEQEFLKNLSTGNYLPLKLKSEDSTTDQYRLIRIKVPVNKEEEDIHRYLVFFGYVNTIYFSMEGKPLPEFRFHALNGHTYTNENCKGKFIILNCWFVGCHACVEEMPELNELVDKYHDNDIVFISLALSSKKRLKRFLSKVKFKYVVVPHAGDYINDSINVFMFPTHVVVNKRGNIVSFQNYAKDLKSTLNQLAEAGKLSIN